MASSIVTGEKVIKTVDGGKVRIIETERGDIAIMPLYSKRASSVTFIWDSIQAIFWLSGGRMKISAESWIYDKEVLAVMYARAHQILRGQQRKLQKPENPG